MSDFSRTPTRPGATTLRRAPAAGVALDDTADELEPVEPDRRVAITERRIADRVLVRLAVLETWRADADAWRLRLTGVADSNGRIGRLADAVADLRTDVGETEARRAERAAVAGWTSDRRRILAALATAAALAGGSIKVALDSRDAAAEARGRDAEWRRHVDEHIKTCNRSTP